jgi:hypothetical protein
MTTVSKEIASQIAVEHIKLRKGTEKIDVANIEAKGDCWIVQGTCPIDMGGHQWAEKFQVLVDGKGQIRALDFALL